MALKYPLILKIGIPVLLVTVVLLHILKRKTKYKGGEVPPLYLEDDPFDTCGFQEVVVFDMELIAVATGGEVLAEVADVRGDFLVAGVVFSEHRADLPGGGFLSHDS